MGILGKNSIFSFSKIFGRLSFLNLSTLKYLSFGFLSTLLLGSSLLTNITSANSDSIFTIEGLNLNQEHISSNGGNNNGNQQGNNQKGEKKIINEENKGKLSYKDLDEYQKKYYMDGLNKIMNEGKFQGYNFERQQLIDIDGDGLKEIVFRHEQSGVKKIYSIHFNGQTFELKKHNFDNNENGYGYEDYFVLEKNGKRKFLLLSRWSLFIGLHESTNFGRTINYHNIETYSLTGYKKISNFCLNFIKNGNKTYINDDNCPTESINQSFLYKQPYAAIDAYTKFGNEEEYINTSSLLNIKNFDKRLDQDDIFNKGYIFSILKFSIKDNQKKEIYYFNNGSTEKYVFDENSGVYVFKEGTEEGQGGGNNLFDFVGEDDETQPKNNEGKILKTTEDQLVVTNNGDGTKNYMIQTEGEEIALSLGGKHGIYFKDLTGDGLKEVITYELMKSESIDKYFKLDIYSYKDGEYKKVLDGIRGTYLTNFDSNNDGIQDIAIRGLDGKINTYIFTGDTSQQTTEIEGDEIIFNDINGDGNKDVITKKKIQGTKDLGYFNIYLFENGAFVKKTGGQGILGNGTQFSKGKILGSKLIGIKKSKGYKVLYFDKSQNIFKDLQSGKVLKTLGEEYLLTLNGGKKISFIDSDGKFYIYEIKDNTLKNTKVIDISKENGRCVNCTDQELNDLEEQFTEIQLPSDTTFKSKGHILGNDAFILGDKNNNSYLLLKKGDHLVKMKDNVNQLEFGNISGDLLVGNRDRGVLVKQDTGKIESLNGIATKTGGTQDTSKIVSFDINKLTYAGDNGLIKESDILYGISGRKSVSIERNFVPSNFKIGYNITNNNSLFNVLYQNTIKIKVGGLSIQENIENTLLRFSSGYNIYGNLGFADLYLAVDINELKSNTGKSLQIVSKIEKAYKNQLPEKYCSDDYSATNKDDLCWKYRNYGYNYRPKSDYYGLLYSIGSIYFRSRGDSMLPYQTGNGNYGCKFYISNKGNFSYTNKPEYINSSSDVGSFFCTGSNNTIKQYQDLKKIFLYKD